MPTPFDVLLRGAGSRLTFRVCDWGGTSPVVVMLHGLTASCRIFDLCALRMRHHYRVITYDQRGHGYSSQPRDGYALEALASDGRSVLAALQVNEPVTLVGHSWGAFVALEWAARYPHQVNRLVLVDGAAFNYRDLPAMTWASFLQEFRHPRVWAESVSAFQRAIQQGPFGFLAPAFQSHYFGSQVFIAPDGTVRGRVSRTVEERILTTLWETDIAQAYAVLRQPTMLLLASPETPTPMEQQMVEAKRQMVPRLEGIHPRLHVRWLTQTMHDVPLHRPDALVETIEAMVDQ